MKAPASIAITPVRVADLLAEGERMPDYVHAIDHPDARVLVVNGMTELHPAVAGPDPRLHPLSQQEFDPAGIDIFVDNRLHFDHCGGNHRFVGTAIRGVRLSEGLGGMQVEQDSSSRGPGQPTIRPTQVG